MALGSPIVSPLLPRALLRSAPAPVPAPLPESASPRRSCRGRLVLEVGLVLGVVAPRRISGRGGRGGGSSRAEPQRRTGLMRRFAAVARSDGGASSAPSLVIPPEPLAEIREGRVKEMAARYQQIYLQLPEEVSNGRPVGAAFVGPEAECQDSGKPPVLLLHGFDSSALEFRRLLPELESLGVGVHFLDLLGWGFGDSEGVQDFSPAAKRAHLYAFWQQVLGGRPMVLGGASLGGGIAIDFAAEYPEAVQRLILIDSQGFIDGAPRVGPLGGLGIKVLSSWPLRWMANRMAYFDKDRYATDDAIRVGKLHLEMDGWESASLDFLNSGGYILSAQVRRVNVPSLLLWGEHDEILDGSDQVPRFVESLQGPVQVEWIPECGHVPHLEQPKLTAKLIADFLAKAGGATATE